MRRSIALLVCVLLLTGTAHASSRYDPRLKFRTLSTAHFDIHFHQGEDAVARRLASIVEAAASELEPQFGRPHGRVHVILVDQSDLSNGWASPLPFDVIEIVAAAPAGGDVIGNTSDWLRLVFVHEYTHILHLDRSRGLFAGLRRIFGRHPAALPNIFTPGWQIEGVATYEESLTSGEGRVHAGDFRLMLDRAAATNQFLSLDRASSAHVDWPSGNTAYLYGAYFHQYLADKYGDASIAKLADETARRIPYLGSRAFKKVFGRSLGDLWADFARDRGRPEDAVPSPAARLTHHGFIASAPAYAPDGRLFYSISNPHGFPSLMELRGDGTSRRVTTRVAGGRMGAGEHTIVFDQVEYVRSVAVQRDLFAVSSDSGKVERITREARAGDPDLSPDGRTIVCTIQSADGRSLATMTLDPRPATPVALMSQPGVNYASPRWSPDGRTIVAERQTVGSRSEIVLVDVASKAVTSVDAASPRGRSVSPSWTPDGRGILFASDRAGGPFQIFLLDVATGQLRRLANAGGTGTYPVLSPDAQTLVFVGYTADGFDLFSLPMNDARWEPVAEPDVDEAAAASLRNSQNASAAEQAPALPVQSYRPAGHLIPRFWTPIVESDGDETAFGAATAGGDALGRHNYAAGGAWSTAGRPDWYAVYVYDRWRPSIFGDTSDDSDSWLEGRIRTRELNVGAAVPFRTVRRRQSVFAAVHLSNERFDCSECELPVDASIERRAVRAGWTFANAKEYGYSISPEHGVTASVASELSPRSFGSTGDATAVIADLRGFLPAAPRHGVLAVRAAAAASWGDDNAVRVFGAAGSGPRVAGLSFNRDAIALIRGFDSDDVVGRRAVVLNADYRIPIVWIERGVGTWPVLLRSLHAAVFADAGAAWNERLTHERRRASAGVELSGDVVVGYFAPVTFASGLAWRHDPTGVNRGAVLFARVGRAF